MLRSKKPKPEPKPPADPLEAAEKCIERHREDDGQDFRDPHRDRGPYIALHLLNIQIEILKELRKGNEK